LTLLTDAVLRFLLYFCYWASGEPRKNFSNFTGQDGRLEISILLPLNIQKFAPLAKLVDAQASGVCESNLIEVRIL
jgi:hypothetical protein